MSSTRSGHPQAALRFVHGTREPSLRLREKFAIERLPAATSRIVRLSADPLNDAEHTKPPGIASTSTLKLVERRNSSRSSAGTTAEA
jgi:hypothetical protein